MDGDEVRLDEGDVVIVLVLEHADDSAVVDARD